MESKRVVLNREIGLFLVWAEAEMDPVKMAELDSSFIQLFKETGKAEKILEVLGKCSFSSEILTSLIVENTGLPEMGVKQYCDRFLKILNM